MAKDYKIISQSEPQDSEIDVVVEIPAEFVVSHQEKALADFVREAEIEGFRKGKAPVAMVKERVGELRIFEEATQRAIQNIIPTILLEEKFDAITMPHVHLTKIAIGQPVEFRMHFFIMPEVELADYKKIAKEAKKEDSKLTDDEVEGYIQQILSSRASKNEAGEEIKPELNDDFVKTLGDFKNVDEFRTQLAENMQNDKNTQTNQKRRLAIMEEIIKQTKIKMPEVLVEEEQQKMLEEFRSRVEGMKMNFEEYLGAIKKTEDELKAEWKDDATKRAKMNLILPNIATKEDIKPENKDIDHELSHLKKQYPDIDESRARVYVASVLTNEKVFQFLETL